MSAMASKNIHLRVSDEIRAALDRHCQRHNLELSAFIRATLMREIGKPELLDTMPPEGRQPKPKPTPVNKKKRGKTPSDSP